VAANEPWDPNADFSVAGGGLHPWLADLDINTVIDMSDEEGPMGDEEEVTFKTIQKTTGRLAQKIREFLSNEENEVTREGTLLHLLMECLTTPSVWPVQVPEEQVIAQWLSCTPEQAQIIRKQAVTILSQPECERFFNPQYFQFARNEMELVHEGELLRFDRIVMLDDGLWILDYKRNYHPSQQEDYQSQLQRYRHAVAQLYPTQPINTALITVDGHLWQLHLGEV
jgi:ATP-dependent exoDNAse (exonuclease V) beta subunit